MELEVKQVCRFAPCDRTASTHVCGANITLSKASRNQGPGRCLAQSPQCGLSRFSPNPGSPVEKLYRNKLGQTEPVFIYFFCCSSKQRLIIHHRGDVMIRSWGGSFEQKTLTKCHQNTQQQTCTEQSPSKCKQLTPNKIKKNNFKQLQRKTNHAKRKQILKLTNSITSLILFTGCITLDDDFHVTLHWIMTFIQ